MVKRVGRYEVGKTLGEGTFGKVKYAVNTETGEKVRASRARLGARGVSNTRPRCASRIPPSRLAGLATGPTRHLARWRGDRVGGRSRATRVAGASDSSAGSLRSAGRHQDPGQGEDPEAEHGVPDQEGGAGWALAVARALCSRRAVIAAQRQLHSERTTQISIMKVVKHDNVVKLYEVLASRTKVRLLAAAARVDAPAEARGERRRSKSLCSSWLGAHLLLRSSSFWSSSLAASCLTRSLRRGGACACSQGVRWATPSWSRPRV